jgi:hypothetical protein
MYARRPHGDSPKFMPLDTSLFNDVHFCFCANRHVMITQALRDTVTKKFSRSTPKRLAESYLRVLHPVTGGNPLSDRILQNCLKWQVSLGVIREAGGAMVEGVGNLFKVPHSTRGWGGRRKQRPPKPMKWLHPDAEGCVEVMVQLASWQSH